MNIDYSSGVIKEHLQDPNLFSQARCEFKLPSEMNVLSNMKLANLNAVRAGGGNCDYNRGAGVASLIKKISLLDGANVLSETREVGKQITFRNFNNSNNVNNSFKSPHFMGAFGFNYGQSQLINGAGTDTFNSYEARKLDNDANQITNTISRTGVVVLSDLLPILNHIELLDKAVFKDGLRIVIEWESDIRKMATANNITLTINQPILCYYTVEDESLYNELKLTAGIVSWYEREVDSRSYTSSVSSTQVYNGFDGKRVLRGYVAKESQTNVPYDNVNQVRGVGKNGSQAFINETFNVINNGVQIYPQDLGYGEIQRQLVNSFGNCSAYQGFNLRQGATQANSMPNLVRLYSDDSVLAGNLSYNGFSLGNEQVRNLQIKLGNPNRGTNVGNGNQDSHNVFVMCDVAKMLSVGSDGSYTVSYT